MNMDFSKAGLYCLLNTPEVQRKLSDLQAANRAVSVGPFAYGIFDRQS